MARLGSQFPSQSVVLEYSQSRGAEAVALYEESGRHAQEWQRLMIENIMAQNDDGLWTHQKFGYEVPRQNGKGEILAMRELWGIVNGERICHTAHKTSTSHSAYVRLYKIMTDAGWVEVGRKKKGRIDPERSFKATKQYGLEQITLANGGSIVFRTRTEAGGIGESFDLLVIDEAQEYTVTQQGALIYTISASPNPQTVFCGTPPTITSKGTVFVNMRKQVLGGTAVDSGWAEWSVYERPKDILDVDLWYATNPSLGTILRERTIRNEDVTNVLDFTIQRLGFWFSYELKSEITEADWKALVGHSALNGKLFTAVKFGADGANVALSVAVKTVDGKIFVETVDCRKQSDGFGWIIDFIRRAKPYSVVIDGKGKSTLLESAIKDEKIKTNVIIPTSAEAVTACAGFRQSIDDGTIQHAGQPSVTQAVANCEKRLIGTNGAFMFRSIKEGVEVAIVESIAMAHWICASTKVKRVQKIGY